MKLIAHIKKLFAWKKRNADTKQELKTIEKFETEATLAVAPVAVKATPTPKPKSNRKPGPKKTVPGTPAVKSNAPKTGSTAKKPRKPKQKVV